jgi:hypothetical protein
MNRMFGLVLEVGCCALASHAVAAVIAALAIKNSRRVNTASPPAQALLGGA